MVNSIVKKKNRFLACWLSSAVFLALSAPREVARGADPFDSIKNASYSGAVVNETDWFLYSAAVRAVSGGIHETGWQLRVMAGKGQYSYTRNSVRYKGDKTSLEVMAGYQLVNRPFFLKLYIGPELQIHTVLPADTGNLLSGEHVGGKLQFESWMDWGKNGFATADFTWSTLENSYVLSGKGGMKLYSGLQLGMEAGLSGDDRVSRYYGGFLASYRLSDRQAMSVTVGGSQSNISSDIGLYSKFTFDIKF